MTIIQEIESIQQKIKQHLSKHTDLKTAEQFKEYIDMSDFQKHYMKFEKSKWKPSFYLQIKADLTKAEVKDSFVESSELVRVLKYLYAERFLPK